jgi:hypothetical protein
VEHKRYKSGDVREDGLIFWAYRPERKNKEYWVSPERFNSLRNNSNKNWNLRRNTPTGRIRDFSKQIYARYGITHKWYEELFQQQGCVCAICKQPEQAKLNGKVKRLAVDHCHDTGKVRGLLCCKCNTAIGLLDHDVQKIDAAQAYIHKSIN